MMATMGTNHSGDIAQGKLTKPRVKPILKKFGSNSEKNSLDLDSSWGEQRADGSGLWNGAWSSGGDSRERTARDVTFSLSSERKYVHHARSASGTSHNSHVSITTTGSSNRAGTFIHPFQQMPRTSTPPLLSYANSPVSFDNPREYSPTITEDDDDALEGLSSSYPYHSPSPVTTTTTVALHSRSQSNLRRPSLISRSSSRSDATSLAPSSKTGSTPSTSTTTATTSIASRTPAKSRRPSAVSGSSRSDLNLNTALAVSSHLTSKSLPCNAYLDFEPSGLLTSPAPASTAILSPPVVGGVNSAVVSSANGSTTPLSPLRSSVELAGFSRLRNCPEVSSAAHMDMVRNQRRKFEEKEYRKQERWDQKIVRKRDRDLTREAAKKEEEAAKARKNSMGSARRHSSIPHESPKSKSNPSLTTGFSQLKKKSPSSSEAVNSEEVSRLPGDTEKIPTFPTFERNFTGTLLPPNAPTVEEDVHFTPLPRKRSNAAKARTNGAWTGFILWLRSKLFKLSKTS